MVQCTGLSLSLSRPSPISHCSSTSCFGCALSESILRGSVKSWSESIQCGLLDLSASIDGAKVLFGVNWGINPSCSSGSDMLHQRRLQDAECAGAASAPKRIRGSAAGSRSGAGFEADPVMRSSPFHMATSPKEPSEDTEPYPWRMPIPTEELEPASAPLPVGPIGLWQSAMITKYDLMLIEFNRDGTKWTVLQRSKHCSVSRIFLREKPENVRFMIIVTDTRNESTREIIKVSRNETEATPLSYLARAPIELVPRPCGSKHLASRQIRPPVMPTPQREK